MPHWLERPYNPGAIATAMGQFVSIVRRLRGRAARPLGTPQLSVTLLADRRGRNPPRRENRCTPGAFPAVVRAREDARETVFARSHSERRLVRPRWRRQDVAHRSDAVRL